MSVQVSTQIDELTKQRFDGVCESIGISPSNALNIFIKGVINHNGIPFSVTAPPEKPSELPFDRGSMKGKMWMADDFAPMEEFREYLGLPPKKPKMTREEMFGCMRGQFKMADDFDAPLEDFKEYME